MRHLFIVALFVWSANSFPEPLEPLLVWNDDMVVWMARTRFVHCPRCGAKPGYRCIGLDAMAGKPMRLHHLPRGVEARRVFGEPRLYDLPLIPFLVIYRISEVRETQKRAEAQR